MNNGKKQATSKKVKCDICGKPFLARGVKSHIRLFHKLKVTEKTIEIVEKKFAPIKKISHNTTKVIPNDFSHYLSQGGTLIDNSSHIPTLTDEEHEIRKKNALAFTKWYVRGKEFNSQEDAHKWLETNSICGHCGLLLVNNKCPECKRIYSHTD
jgi:hypothetical protein